MFDIGYSELLLIGIVALLVIGPKDLPRVLRQVGQWVGKGREMARHFRSGVDNMIRESELDDMNKQWAAQNAAIMAETSAASIAPPSPVVDDPEDLDDRAEIASSDAASPEERDALFAEHEPIPAPHLQPEPPKPAA